MTACPAAPRTWPPSGRTGSARPAERGRSRAERPGEARNAMLDPELVQDLLRRALATGGRFAEVYAEDRVTTTIRLDDRKIEEVLTGTDRGAGVRVFHGPVQAYAFSNRLDPASLREVAEAAASAIRDGKDGTRVLDLRTTPVITHPIARPPAEVP